MHLVGKHDVRRTAAGPRCNPPCNHGNSSAQRSTHPRFPGPRMRSHFTKLISNLPDGRRTVSITIHFTSLQTGHKIMSVYTKYFDVCCILDVVLIIIRYFIYWLMRVNVIRSKILLIEGVYSHRRVAVSFTGMSRTLILRACLFLSLAQKRLRDVITWIFFCFFFSNTLLCL